MSETAKKDTKRDKKGNPEDSKKPERSVQARHVDYAKGYVVADNIRKEINSCERKLNKNRNEKYDYLSGQYFRKILAVECAKAGLPVDTFDRKSPEDPVKKSPIPLNSSPRPIPITSSRIVGWRSSRREYDLEFVGPFYVSAKRTIEPSLLPEEFRVTQQKFIFLG